MGSHFSRLKQYQFKSSAFLILTSLIFLNFACSSIPREEDAAIEKGPTLQVQLGEAKSEIQKLQDKVQDLEVRLVALNDKINLETTVKESVPIQKEKIEVPAAHARIVPSTGAPAFAQSESVDRYREAKILYDSKRYSDAVLEFANFVKNYPDDTLAPGAQYHIGMAYFKQSEFKLAEEELNRGLLTYPHSEFVPDSLLSLIQVSQALQKTPKVVYYRQKLMSSFPNSPQAKNIPTENLSTQNTSTSSTTSAANAQGDVQPQNNEHTAPVEHGEGKAAHEPSAPSAPVAPEHPSTPTSHSEHESE